MNTISNATTSKSNFYFDSFCYISFLFKSKLFSMKCCPCTLIRMFVSIAATFLLIVGIVTLIIALTKYPNKSASQSSSTTVVGGLGATMSTTTKTTTITSIYISIL